MNHATDTCVIRGMVGMGDNIYQRPAVDHLCRTHGQCYLVTPWPQLYGDMASEYGLRFLPAHANLRMQRASELENSELFSDVPRGTTTSANVRYNTWATRQGVPVFRQLLNCVGLEGDTKLSMPLRHEWITRARWILAGVPKPIVLFRPPTIRTDWRCEPRNPDRAAMQAIHSWLINNTSVVSIADLQDGCEWYDGKYEGAFREYHYGEISVGVIAAMMSIVDLVVSPVGFMVPMSIAVDAKAVVIFGGYAAPEVILGGMDTPNIRVIAPDEPCNCIDPEHACNKTIDPDIAVMIIQKELDRWSCL